MQESYICRNNITLILYCNLGICIVKYDMSEEEEGGELKTNKQTKTNIFAVLLEAAA